MYKIRLAHSSKSPPPGPLQISDDPDVHAEWIEERSNIGKMMKENEIVVADIDKGMEAAREFYRKYPEIFSTVVQTRRGVHLYFTGVSETYKWELGDIKGSGYCVAPPSIVKGHRYHYVREGELKPFPRELFPPIHQRKEITRDKIRNVMAYLARIESKEGSNGSSGLIRAAAVCRDAGMSEAEATIRLLEWNSGPTVCPPWSHEEIARAITRVYERSAHV